jgi:hypothetical protein
MSAEQRASDPQKEIRMSAASPRVSAEQLDEVVDTTFCKTLKLHLFSYDIPSDSGFPNPSGLLRRFALRFNKSDWIVADGDLNSLWTLIHEMVNIGATPRLYEFSERSSVAIVKDCVKFLRKEIDDYVVRAERSKRKADQKLDDDNDDAEGKHDEYMKRAEEINTRLVEMATVVDEVSKRFGILPNAIKVPAFQAVRDKLHLDMKRRADTFMTAVNKAKNSGTVEGKAMAEAAAKGQVDVGILADYVDENVGDGEAAELREVFSLNPDEHGEE